MSRRAVRMRRGRHKHPTVLSVFGTRPQFVKLAVIWEVLDESFRSILVDSGQHYDFKLAGAFHEETGLRPPDYNLGVGSLPAAVQIGRVAERLDAILRRRRPDAVIVFGDTSTTAGAAVAAAYRNIPLAHVEAGLRSHRRSTPEEKNRILADHLSDWLFAPTETAVANLHREGITRGVIGCGDLMYENWRRSQGQLPVAGTLAKYRLTSGEYYFLTCHRAETVDDPARLQLFVRMLKSLNRPTVFPVHPRTRKNLRRAGLWVSLRRRSALMLMPPLSHGESLGLIQEARAVLTDSGGVQREACWSGTPCLLLRDRTEWVELLRSGAVRLVDLDAGKVQRALARRRRGRPVEDRYSQIRNPSRRIANRLARDLAHG